MFHERNISALPTCAATENSSLLWSWVRVIHGDGERRIYPGGTNWNRESLSWIWGKSLLWGWQSTWNRLPRETGVCSSGDFPNLPGSCVSCSGWTCFSRRAGLGELQHSVSVWITQSSKAVLPFGQYPDTCDFQFGTMETNMALAGSDTGWWREKGASREAPFWNVTHLIHYYYLCAPVYSWVAQLCFIAPVLAVLSLVLTDSNSSWNQTPEEMSLVYACVEGLLGISVY